MFLLELLTDDDVEDDDDIVVDEDVDVQPVGRQSCVLPRPFSLLNSPPWC